MIDVLSSSMGISKGVSRPEERAELADLQRQAVAYRDRIAVADARAQ
ncbi:MAG: hypothetical protein U1D30_01080 [Planctomycetota bacterium]